MMIIIAISIILLLVLTATSEARHLNEPTVQRKKDGPSSGIKKIKPPKPCKKCGSGGDGDDGGDDYGGDDDGDEIECFPSSAEVTLSSFEEVRMDNLQTGQSILLANNEESDVFAFLHKDSKIFSTFYHFVTPAGNLTVTKGHYIYAKPSLSARSGVYVAQDIKAGQFLERGDNLMVPVLKVKIVREQGLFNPLTFSGELLVDGFRVSTFTQAVHPMMASSLLAPVRALFRIIQFDILSSMFSQGCPVFLKRFTLQVKPVMDFSCGFRVQKVKWADGFGNS